MHLKTQSILTFVSCFKRYLVRQLCTTLIVPLVISLVISLFISPSIHTADNAESTGSELKDKINNSYIFKIEDLINHHKKEHEKKSNEILYKLTDPKDLKQIQDLKIMDYHLKEILFFTNENYLLLLKDECSIIALLDNDLLKDSTGTVQEIFVNYTTTPITSTATTTSTQTNEATISVQDYIQLKLAKCPDLQEIKKIYNTDNLKNTFSNKQFSIPQNSSDCKNLFQKLSSSDESAYICGISNLKNNFQKLLSSNSKTFVKDKNTNNHGATSSIDAAVASKIKFRYNKYQELISGQQFFILDKYCQNINNSEKFCSEFSSDDIWLKAINKLTPEVYIVPRCQKLQQQEKVNLTTCRESLINTPLLCVNNVLYPFPSLTPKENCQNISMALLSDNLRYQNVDCPALIDNDGITNLSRILNHFFPLQQMNINEQNCSSIANALFAKLNASAKKEVIWPLEVCYIDIITKKQICLPVIPGDLPGNPLSETFVISKILRDQKNMPNNSKCKLERKENFNVSLLEYASNCFITYDQNNCTAINCPKKIFYKGKEVVDIKIQGRPVFDYFPISVTQNRYAISKMLEDVHDIYGKELINLAEIKMYFENNKNGIAHGIGCIEYILPELFPTLSFNQCTPTPFIISGAVKSLSTLKNDSNINFVLRVAADDINAPRIISWKKVLQSVSKYQEQNPLNTWTLFGLQKR